MKHITLLGDSIFDNKSYVGVHGIDVITHLRQKIADRHSRMGWTADLKAVDGSRAHHVAAQIAGVSDETTNIFVSVGGNDALYEAEILNLPISSSAQVFSELSDRAAAFENRYAQMLETVLNLGKPTALCTIYYPRMEQPAYQKLAVAALASFNDVIIRQAFRQGLPLIDLRFVCDDDRDYANPIEPSEAGGAKIADVILQVAETHNFLSGRTIVYF